MKCCLLLARVNRFPLFSVFYAKLLAVPSYLDWTQTIWQESERVYFPKMLCYSFKHGLIISLACSMKKYKNVLLYCWACRFHVSSQPSPTHFKIVSQFTALQTSTYCTFDGHFMLFWSCKAMAPLTLLVRENDVMELQRYSAVCLVFTVYKL